MPHTIDTPQSDPPEDEGADPCNGCEGSCRICSNRYRAVPGEFYGRPTNEQMEYFKRENH